MNPSKKNRAIESLFILLIFTVFMVTSLLTVMIGANVYRKVVGETESNNALRASFSYIANKVRAADANGGVRIEQTDDGPVLCLETDFGGEIFHTYIYHHDGSLREYIAYPEDPFDPQYGDIILEIESFSMEQAGELLTFSASEEDGGKQSLKLRLRSSTPS